MTDPDISERQPSQREYRERVRDQCRRLGHSGMMTRDEAIVIAVCYARDDSVAQAAAKIINERLRTGRL